MSALTSIIILAIFNEKFNELVIKPLIKDVIKVRFDYISSITGLLFAVMFNLNIFILLDFEPSQQLPIFFVNVISVIVTGLLIGAGSNIIHDIINSIKGVEIPPLDISPKINEKKEG
jgi:hypothetical protein